MCALTLQDVCGCIDSSRCVRMHLRRCSSLATAQKMALKRARSLNSLASSSSSLHGSSSGFSEEHKQLKKLKIDAGIKLHELLTGMYAAGEISGEKVALISYYHQQSGGEGLEDLQVNPATASKHGDEVVTLAIGRKYKPPELYMVKVPLYERKGTIRDSIDIPVRLPSMIVDDTYRESPPSKEALELNTAQYRNHPVVNSSAGPVLPLALYWDGVEYTKNDAFIGFYIRNLISGRVQMVSFLRLLLLI